VIEKMRLGKGVDRGFMLSLDTGEAALVFVKAGQLSESVLQPIAAPGAFLIRPINPPKFA
jgi:hypothetical protein